MKLTLNIKTDIKKLTAPVAKLQKIVEFYANEMRNEVVDNVIAKNIIDTGTLLNSIQNEPISVGFLRAEVATRVHYAIYHEEGTSKMRARPFFRPAFEKVNPQFIAAIEKAI